MGMKSFVTYLALFIFGYDVLVENVLSIGFC